MQSYLGRRSGVNVKHTFSNIALFQGINVYNHHHRHHNTNSFIQCGHILHTAIQNQPFKSLNKTGLLGLLETADLKKIHMPHILPLAFIECHFSLLRRFFFFPAKPLDDETHPLRV